MSGSTMRVVTLVLAVATLSLAGAPSVSAAQPQVGAPADPRLALHVLAALNAVRAQHRLRPLSR
jgi:hypothetical protein